MERKEWGLLIAILAIIVTCIVLRVWSGIELSNVNDNNQEQTNLVEQEYTNTYIDLSKLKKKVKEKITVINNIIYEKVTNKDKKNNNALVSVVDGNVDKKVKPLSKKVKDYENAEVTEKDLIISSKLKVKVK